MEFSSTLNISLQRCLNPLFQNQRLVYLLSPLVCRISQPEGQDQQNDKQKECLLSPWFFKINLKDTPSHISIDSLGLYIPPECFLF